MAALRPTLTLRATETRQRCGPRGRASRSILPARRSHEHRFQLGRQRQQMVAPRHLGAFEEPRRAGTIEQLDGARFFDRQQRHRRMLDHGREAGAVSLGRPIALAQQVEGAGKGLCQRRGGTVPADPHRPVGEIALADRVDDTRQLAVGGGRVAQELGERTPASSPTIRIEA